MAGGFFQGPFTECRNSGQRWKIGGNSQHTGEQWQEQEAAKGTETVAVDRAEENLKSVRDSTRVDLEPILRHVTPLACLVATFVADTTLITK
ncbi:Bacterio-opsin activator HTH domain-containing protein [Anopheles sinensis]|uniref:Bacterio-opsin activator HTH domain-containing protein n=1 Tax=Anopheles sinensis TaxID=74873 RepID=A0A084W8K0_ANOSI|nr:Bacterio-opsin activator HTH domain-containing protein [Anopheles sinensis]